MSHNAYYEIHLHLVWHTKKDAPLLRGPVEATVHNYLRDRIKTMDGVYLDHIGGTDDHVHLAVHIAPTIAIADVIGDLKGASAHEVNVQLQQKLVYWQDGYGVVSFGRRNLPFVTDYIRDQREHHAKGSHIERLERITCSE